jgi:hypothetical protein
MSLNRDENTSNQSSNAPVRTSSLLQKASGNAVHISDDARRKSDSFVMSLNRDENTSNQSSNPATFAGLQATVVDMRDYSGQVTIHKSSEDIFKKLDSGIIFIMFLYVQGTWCGAYLLLPEDKEIFADRHFEEFKPSPFSQKAPQKGSVPSLLSSFLYLWQKDAKHYNDDAKKGFIKRIFEWIPSSEKFTLEHFALQVTASTSNSLTCSLTYLLTHSLTN